MLVCDNFWAGDKEQLRSNTESQSNSTVTLRTRSLLIRRVLRDVLIDYLSLGDIETYEARLWVLDIGSKA